MKAKVKATGKIVDGIPIYYGSEGKGYLDVPVDHDIFDRYDIEEVELLEQQPLHEGLDEAADNHIRRVADAVRHRGWDLETKDIADAFKAGAKWMKAKMIEEAVEGEVTTDNRGNNVVRAGVFNKDFEYVDKVKIIIIKER